MKRFAVAMLIVGVFLLGHFRTSLHLPSLGKAPVGAVIFVLCYLIGSIPFGLLAGRLAGIDIRQHGSGNIGATNVWRVLGKKWGLPVFLLDVAKGLTAAILGKVIAGHWEVVTHLPHLKVDVDHLDVAIGGIVGAMASILGHNFPLWLRFKGGKGVATSLGVLFGLMPLASTITFAIWGLVFKVTRYVSLASIIGALSLPITVLVLLMVPLPWGMEGWAYFYFVVVATMILVLRHTANIKRLLAGTEPRMGEKKNDDDISDEETAESAAAPEAPAASPSPIPPPVGTPQTTAAIPSERLDPVTPSASRTEPPVIDAEWERVDEEPPSSFKP